MDRLTNYSFFTTSNPQLRQLGREPAAFSRAGRGNSLSVDPGASGSFVLLASTDNLQHCVPGREQCLQDLLLQPPAPSAHLPTLPFRGSGKVMTRTSSLWCLASCQEESRQETQFDQMAPTTTPPPCDNLPHVSLGRWWQGTLSWVILASCQSDGKRHYPSDTRTLLWRNGCAHPCSSRSCTHMRTEEGRLEWGRICKIAHRGPQTQLKRPQEPGLERSCDWIEFLWILAWRPFGTRGRLPSWRPDPA